MSKKEKPVKVAKGRYTYKGYKVRCIGTHGAGKEVEWHAEVEKTGEMVCWAISLHELVKLIDMVKK